MKIILTQNHKTLGKMGEITSVSDGFAINFLFPQGIAQAATPQAIANCEAKKKAMVAQEAAHKADAQKLAEQISGKKVTIIAKAKEEKLFGSVGAKEIAAAVTEHHGADVTAEMVVLDEPLKELTTREVVFDLGHDITAPIILTVRSE